MRFCKHAYPFCRKKLLEMKLELIKKQKWKQQIKKNAPKIISNAVYVRVRKWGDQLCE